MEQKGIQTYRSTVESFFWKIYLKNVVVSVALVFILFSTGAVLFLKLSLENSYSKMASNIQSSFRVLIETMILDEDLYQTLVNNIKKNNGFISIKVLRSLKNSQNTLYCIEDRICWNHEIISYRFKSNWGGNIYYIEGTTNFDLIDIKSALIVLIMMVLFGFMVLVIFVRVNKGIKENIAIPLKSIWSDISGESFPTQNFALEEVDGLWKAIVEFKQLSKIKLSMLIAKEFVHEIKSPTFFLYNQFLRLQKFPKNRDKIINQTIELIEPKLSRQNKTIQTLAGDIYTPEFSSVNITKYLNLDTTYEENILIRGDEDLIKVLFSNLYRNAFEACGTRDLIKTKITVREYTVEITIANPHQSKSIDFSKLFKKGFTTKAMGSGIGLSLCKHIIQMHQGRIFANAENNIFIVTIILNRLIID